MAITDNINSLNAGVWDERVQPRDDLEKYRKSCRVMQNFIPRTEGGAEKRHGDEWMGEAKYHDRTFGLVEFKLGNNTPYILEMGDQYLRFWSNGIRVIETEKFIINLTRVDATLTITINSHGYSNGDVLQFNDVEGMVELNKQVYTVANATTNTFDVTPANGATFTAWTSITGKVGKVYEISTPYDEADVARLQFRQQGDVIYIVNTDQRYALRKLQRLGNTNWTLAVVDFSFPPVLDTNVSDVTLTASATTGSITVSASAATFTSDHIGSRWLIRHPRGDIQNTVTLGSTSTYPSSGGIRVRGNWTFTPHGTWSGDVKIQRSYALDTPVWEDYLGTSNRTNTQNQQILGNEPVEVLLRISFTYTSGSLVFDWNIEDYDNNGIFEITGLNTASQVTATVIKEIGSTGASVRWAEAAFSDERGHPSAIEFYKGRLWLARDENVFGSVSDDFENFERTGLDDGSIYRPLPSASRNKIKWMVGKRHLLFGTEDGLYAHRRPDNNQATTPSTFSPEAEVYYGMGDLPPILIDNVVIFAEKENRIIRELSSDLVEETFKGIKLTQLAAFITGSSGLTDLTFQRSPLNTLWGIRGDDGALVSMVYDREQDHIAWSEHVSATGDTYVSVATTASTVGDELWVGVKRNIPGLGTRYYIERRQSEKTATNTVTVLAQETPTLETVNVTSQDICYLVDLSGSTASILATFKSNVVQINAGLEARFTSGTVRYALYAFGKDNEIVQLSDFTNHVEIEALIAGLAATSGNFEDGYKAIQLAVDTLNWRTDTATGRNIILLTDEVSGETTVSLERAIAACQSKSIIFNYGFTSKTDYAQIATATGGLLLLSGDDLVNDFIDSIVESRPNSSFTLYTRGADYLDSSMYFTEVADTLTGLDHLEGATVWANADGVTLGPYIVQHGSIALGAYYSKVWVGLQYQADLATAYLEYLFGSGTTKGAPKSITRVTIDALESVGIQVGTSANNLQPLKDEPLGYNTGLKSTYGEPRNVELPQHTRARVSVYIRSEQPQPCYIAGVYPKIEIHG